MAVITISRGAYSGGEQFARCVADHLGYFCLDREELLEKASAFGVSEDDLREALVRPPSLWGRYSHRRRKYLAILQATLAAEVLEGSAVYHGNAGHLLLQGVPHVLRVRIIAPMAFRMALLEKREGTTGDRAKETLLRMDDERRKWTRYLYGVDWEDPALYDVVVNFEHMSLTEACDVVRVSAEEPRFRETEESMRTMADLALASRVRAILVLHPATSRLELEVTAHKGTVFIRGELPSPKYKEKVFKVVGNVPEVRKVDLELLVIQRELRTF